MKNLKQDNSIELLSGWLSKIIKERGNDLDLVSLEEALNGCLKFKVNGGVVKGLN